MGSYFEDKTKHISDLYIYFKNTVYNMSKKSYVKIYTVHPIQTKQRNHEETVFNKLERKRRGIASSSFFSPPTTTTKKPVSPKFIPEIKKNGLFQLDE